MLLEVEPGLLNGPEIVNPNDVVSFNSDDTVVSVILGLNTSLSDEHPEKINKQNGRKKIKETLIFFIITFFFMILCYMRHIFLAME